MSPTNVVLFVGAVLSIAACDKTDSAAPAPAATPPAAAASSSAGEMEHKEREHGREEHMDGGREHEHEDRQPK